MGEEPGSRERRRGAGAGSRPGRAAGRPQAARSRGSREKPRPQGRKPAGRHREAHRATPGAGIIPDAGKPGPTGDTGQQARRGRFAWAVASSTALK